MRGIARYVVQRIVVGWFLFLGLLTLSFSLVSMLPGSPAKAILGEYAAPDDVAALNVKLGLDKPFLERYLDYIGGAMKGDFGKSYFTGNPVLQSLLERVPNTLVYLAPGLILATVLGILFGSVAAYRYRRPADRAFTVGSSVLLAVPEFILALLLIVLCFSGLGIAPAPVGMTSSADAQPPDRTGSLVLDALLGGYWGTFDSILGHAVLPMITVGVFFAAPVSKIVRTGMVQALASPQIEFARACGLRPFQVFRYAMAEIRGTVMTYFVIMLASAISGAAIVESVFSWPGVGGWSLTGVLANDIPVIQGFVVIMGTASLLGYIVLDVTTTLLDPRTRGQVSGKRRPSPRVLAKGLTK
ncbi:ABC transporter permease [Nocardioides ginsengisoli]|uniref:ABC transporter permease n=1 Tax=Nocardioides ginsengisoli TaxID=363868 RepID=A0ABW3VX51_9ACTN